MGIRNLWTTLDVQTQAGCTMLAKALDANNPKLDDVINTELAITDVVTRDMEGAPDDNGEVKDYMAVTLVCANGNCYFTGSQGIRQSLFMAKLRRGNPPWKPPLRAIVKQRPITLRNGSPGRVYYFEFPPEPK